MNILYTMISFNVGGAEKLMTDILNSWNNSKDKLILCIINDDYKEEMINKIKFKDNIKIEFIKRKKGNKGLNIIIKYLKIIKKYKVDIIHSQDRESMILSIFAKLYKFNIKLYSTIHDTNLYINYNKIYVFLDKIFLNKIISISDAVEKEIESKGVNKSHIEVVYNGINFLDYYTLKEKEKNNIYKIGCVARIQPKKKGQDILIKAINLVIKKYPDTVCYFAGAYEDKDLTEYKELIKLIDKLNLRNNIVFLGNVQKINKFLNGLDLFVLPSRNEGFGLVILEAIAAKVPVIVSNIQGPKEIIKEDKYGLKFEVDDYKDLANKIIYRIEHKEENLDNIYEYYRKKFDINEMIKKLRKIYVE